MSQDKILPCRFKILSSIKCVGREKEVETVTHLSFRCDFCFPLNIRMQFRIGLSTFLCVLKVETVQSNLEVSDVNINNTEKNIYGSWYDMQQSG